MQCSIEGKYLRDVRENGLRDVRGNGLVQIINKTFANAAGPISQVKESGHRAGGGDLNADKGEGRDFKSYKP
jgi:hypothetical protein